MTLRPVARLPAGRDATVDRLLGELRRLLESHPEIGLHELGGLEEPGLESGDLTALHWRVGKPPLDGIAMWDFVPGVGRRILIYLPCEETGPVTLDSLIGELEGSSEHDGPIASVTLVGPGRLVPGEAELFLRRGYFRVDRLVLRLVNDGELPDELAAGRPDLRSLTASDEGDLVDLLRESYDRLSGEANPWLLYRDPRRDAREAVRDMLSGRRGAWVPWASFGVDLSGRLRGAVVVNRSDRPRVSEVVVSPSMRGIGLGYHLVLEAARTLRERGEPEPEAVITSHDLRALRLFRRVGFEPLDDRGQAVWVRGAAVGVGSVP
jgi:GNAT superfamily N-acetyltransferase